MGYFCPDCGHEEGKPFEPKKPNHGNVGDWIAVADKLPGQVGDQVDVLMWSPEWATWLKGMVTRWEDECEWAIYNQQDDRYHEWPYPPEFWMSPILPNAKVEARRK